MQAGTPTPSNAAPQISTPRVAHQPFAQLGDPRTVSDAVLGQRPFPMPHLGGGRLDSGLDDVVKLAQDRACEIGIFTPPARVAKSTDGHPNDGKVGMLILQPRPLLRRIRRRLHHPTATRRYEKSTACRKSGRCRNSKEKGHQRHRRVLDGKRPRHTRSDDGRKERNRRAGRRTDNHRIGDELT